MNWVAYVGRRVAVMVLSLGAVSLAVFGLLFISPGKPEQILLGTQAATPGALAAIRSRYGLDRPFLVQYGHWVWHALHFDFGESIQTAQPVSTVIGERVWITGALAAMALLLVVLLAVPAGLVAGVRSRSVLDRAVTVLCTVSLSAPAFAVGTLLLYVFAVTLGWFPVFGAGDGLPDRLWHLALPAVTLALTGIALVARQTRAAALDVWSRDFTTFARARGLPGRVVWGRYALRNSALPVVTSTGVVLAYFLTGAVLVEETFSVPGLGSLVVSSVTSKDVPVVQGVSLLAAALVLLVNFVADLAHLALDARVRKGALA